MKLKHFFDKDTSTLTYIVYDEKTLDAVVIDPVLDFDPPSGKVEDKSAQLVLSFLQEHKLNLHYILETHVHADHMSSSQILKKKYPAAKIAISHKINVVQDVFKGLFNLPDFKPSGEQFDFLIKDNEEFNAGSIKIKAIATPGHTPACMSFLIGDMLFTGDALFMPDSGTGRCDFPKGSAKDLYYSISTLYKLPDATKIYVGHDYQPNNREILFESTIAESKKANIHLKATTSEDEFVTFREGRDKTLKAPRLLLPSLQINMAAGHFPEPESNGKSYLKLPLAFGFILNK